MKAFHEVRNYRSDFMVWQCAYTNISFLAHWHQEIELVYLRSGSARFCINEHNFTARAGDLVLIDTGDIHYSDSSEMKNELDFLIFDPSVVSPLYRLQLCPPADHGKNAGELGAHPGNLQIFLRRPIQSLLPRSPTTRRSSPRRSALSGTGFGEFFPGRPRKPPGTAVPTCWRKCSSFSPIWTPTTARTSPFPSPRKR